MAVRYVQIFKVILILVTSVSRSTEGTDCNLDNNHVLVWFDYNIRHYGGETENAYKNEDLATMVQVVAKRFNTIVLDPMPTNGTFPLNSSSHSLLRIPNVVAEHNKKNSQSKCFQPMRIITSVPSPAINILSRFTSPRLNNQSLTKFQLLNYVATDANKISSGTVTAVLLHTKDYYKFFDRQIADITLGQVRQAKDTLNKNGRKYDIGIVTKLHGCRKNFQDARIKKTVDSVVPHLDWIALVAHKSIRKLGHRLDGNDTHKIFSTEFDDCETRLKSVNKHVQVVPIVVCMEDFTTDETSWTLDCWRLMREWAKTNDRDVIMYGAFDSPQGIFSPRKSGWWRLKHEAVFDISETSFVEKIQESTQNPTNETKNAIEMKSGKVDKNDDSKFCSPYHFNTEANSSDSSLTTAVTLLSLICVFLIFVDIGIIYYGYVKHGAFDCVSLYRRTVLNQRTFGNADDVTRLTPRVEALT